MGIRDELKAIEDALSGDEAKAKGWLADLWVENRRPILIAGTIILALFLWLLLK